MKFWLLYGAMPGTPSSSPPRPAGSAIGATLQQLKKDSRWRKGALGTLFVFACTYCLVFLSGFDCSPSSISTYDSREVQSMYCKLKSWSFLSSSDVASDDDSEELSASISVRSEEEEEERHNVSARVGTRTGIDRIVFGIGGNAGSWTERKEYIKLWWKPGVTRGFVWADQPLDSWKIGDPPFKISEDTSRFSLTNIHNGRSALRITRIVSETFRLGLPNVDWFVMGDDDTLFFTENLVNVLSKYDPRKLHYIGMNSEDTRQVDWHHYGLAFGGGGFAISYPLAKALSKGLDECMERYPDLYGSDERVKACVSELGVPLTREVGFHQMDLHGDVSGFLAAHPVAPIVSLHHLDDIDPIFYGSKQLDAMTRLMKASTVDPASLFQQSMCYDSQKRWSFSVAWGYVVEVYEGFVSPRDLELPARTFVSWASNPDFGGFTMDTRALADVCSRPTRFFMGTAQAKKGKGNKRVGITTYERLKEFEKENCGAKAAPMATIKVIIVESEPFPEDWYESPQRHCCSIKRMNTASASIRVGACDESESLVDGVKLTETKRKTRRFLTESTLLDDFGRTMSRSL